jgi:hypothetical protein
MIPRRVRVPVSFPDPNFHAPPPWDGTRDLFLAQRFARHVSPLTTIVYTHLSDEEMFQRVRGLTC